VRDQATRRRDQRLLSVLLLSFILGAVCLAFATWAMSHPWRAPRSYRAALPELGLVTGLIFIGFALYELVHRVRKGPQQPGRHARVRRPGSRVI
jgi:heme/copper-type cytochrome/quinol oxidase subunit 3